MWTVNGYFGGSVKFTDNHQCFDGAKIDIKMIHYVEAIDLVNKKITK